MSDGKAVAEILDILHKILTEVRALSGSIMVMDGRIAAMSANLNRLDPPLRIDAGEIEDGTTVH